MSFVEGNLSLDIQLAPGTLERLQKQLTNLERGVRVGVSADTKGLAAGTRGLESLNTAALRTANTVHSRLGGAAKATAATFGVLAAAGGAGLVAIATKAILAGKEFNVLQQQVRASLTAILGTSQAAEGLLARVNKLNDTSPFPRSAFLSATQQLVGFGVAAKKVEPILDAVQEAVAGIGGDANDIQMFTRAFAQIQSQGRLTGDVLFSLGAKGVDAAAIIGKEMGKTGTEIKEEVTKGAIGADQAIDLLTKGLKTKFNGAVANVAKSYIGAADRVQARLRDIGADITKAFINPLGGGAAVDGLNNIAVALSNIRKNVISQLLPGIQSFADLFVKATESFKNFTANIKMEQVQKFLDIFKMLAPLVALLGTSLVKSLGDGIPIIGTFTRALSGPVIALALFAATVPAVREAIIKMVEALKPAVEALLPALSDMLTSSSGVLTTMAPLLTALATAFATLVSAATPLLKLLEFGPVQAILTALVARFLILKIAGTSAFQSIGYSALQASAAMQAAAVGSSGVAGGVGKVAGAANMAKGAVKGVGSAIGGLLTPTTLFLGAIALVVNKMAQLKAGADAAAASTRAAILEGLDLEDQPDMDIGVGRAEKDVTDLQKKIDDLTGGSKTVSNAFDPGGVFGIFGNTGTQKKIANTEAALKSAKKTLDELNAKGDVKSRVLADSMATSGQSIDAVTAKAKELGIVLTSVAPDQVGAKVKQIVDALNAEPTKEESGFSKLRDTITTAADAMDKIRGAQDKLVASQRGVRDAIKGVEAAERTLADLRRVTAQELADRVTKAELSLASARRGVAVAADRLVSSELALTQAKRGVGQADERLAQLNKERSALLADVTRATRELAAAEADATRIKAELLDQEQQREALLRTQADLAATSGDKLAAADRAILRAKIALNTATREEKELLESLNKTQTAGLDLSGLSLDQIKTKLAGARAELAVQRRTTETKKTQEQIDDEKLTASLNVVDAEQAHRDAIQARGELEYNLGIQKRENDEALNALALDNEATLRRQTEQQFVLSALRSGDTESARQLKALDLEIITATEGITTAALTLKAAEREVFDAIDGQKASAIAVRDAQKETETAALATRDHARDIKSAVEGIQTAQENVRDAQKTVRDDAAALNTLVATQKGDQEEINRLLLARLGLNTQLMAQNPDMAKKLAEQMIALLPDDSWADLLPDYKNASTTAALVEILMRRPQDLAAFLRQIGFTQSSEGNIFTKHSLTQIGEGGKAEVVLPLTKPGRAMTLLAQSIPLMHSSLQKKLAPALAPQSGLGMAASVTSLVPSYVASTVRRGSSTKAVPFVGKQDGPVTYGQLEELIELLKKQKGDVRVEAPITVMTSGDDAALMRKLSRRIERQVNDILSRR